MQTPRGIDDALPGPLGIAGAWGGLPMSRGSSGAVIRREPTTADAASSLYTICSLGGAGLTVFTGAETVAVVLKLTSRAVAGAAAHAPAPRSAAGTHRRARNQVRRPGFHHELPAVRITSCPALTGRDIYDCRL